MVLESKAALWTDGRYFLQAERELDPKDWQLMKSGVKGTPTLEEWLKDEVEGKKIGFDPRLITYSTPKVSSLSQSLID